MEALFAAARPHTLQARRAGARRGIMAPRPETRVIMQP